MFIVHLHYYDANLLQHEYNSIALQFFKVKGYMDIIFTSWSTIHVIHSYLTSFYFTKLSSYLSLKLIDVVVIFTHASCMMKITGVEIGPIVHAHISFIYKQIRCIHFHSSYALTFDYHSLCWIFWITWYQLLYVFNGSNY
jgi:hypothetical protein